MKNPTFFYNQMDFTLHARITTFVHPFQPVFTMLVTNSVKLYVGHIQ